MESLMARDGEWKLGDAAVFAPTVTFDVALHGEARRELPAP
jgi:hypothetical protein